MKNRTKDKTIEEFQKSYNIQDQETVLRLLGIKSKLSEERNVDMSNEELLSFLNNAMNYGEMQIWLMKKELEGVELSLSDQLKKFFEIKTDEDILVLYDTSQNYDEKNIKNVREFIKSGK